MPVEMNERVVGAVRVTTLTLDHPPVNVLDLALCRELERVIVAIRESDTSRVVVLRGKGRFFSTGVDIKQHTPDRMPELLPAFHALFHRLLDLRAVTVAAVHGLCLGGAAELALSCDRVLATPDARIGFPEMKVGCYPPVAIALLAGRVGSGRAAEMILGGRDDAAENLARDGAVDRVGPDLDALLEEELSLYADKSPSVLGMAASLLHDEARDRWGTRIARLEREYLRTLLPHPDASEGIAAFLAKRSPRWLGGAADAVR